MIISRYERSQCPTTWPCRTVFRNVNYFYAVQEQQRRDAETDAKVARLQADLANTNASEWDDLRRRARAFIAAAETARDLTRTWIVVDMDMYALVLSDI